MAAPYGAFTVRKQLTDHDGWKVLTDETQITKRLLQRNGTHLSMPGYYTFANGLLATEVGHDREGEAVKEMLKGMCTLDTDGLDMVHASSEMRSFLPALQIPDSTMAL